jgi:Protein of unknown function (DUF3489)
MTTSTRKRTRARTNQRPAKIHPAESQDRTLPPNEAATCEPGTALAPRPRAGGKRALLLDLLTRPQGATLDELVAATGWLPHTTRAALTGLRKLGHRLERHPGEDGKRTYRITGSPEPDATLASAQAEA